MVLVPVTCPYCHSDQIIKGGQTELNPDEVEVVIRIAEEAEVGEM